MADRDPGRVSAEVDWREAARLVLTSREMDRIEEEELVPAKKILYQFSARGHDMAQVLLGLKLKDGDGVFGYYRSRPLLLALGVPLADALGSGMGLASGYSDGRDIGVVFNYPNPGGAHALPMCGGVGAQYTPAAGWAQAIAYKQKALKEGPSDSISLVLGGDASCATGGFWAALTIATTQALPLVIYIEDNGYGISVPSEYQTPGKDIAANLASFGGLTTFDGDGTDPIEAAKLIEAAVSYVRQNRTPALLRLIVPRLEGHSFQDTQTYKSKELIEAEWARDPLPRLKAHCARMQIGDATWCDLEREAAWQVEAARAEAEARGVSSPDRVTEHVFYEGELQQVGGLWNSGYAPPDATDEPAGSGQRINMVTAIRRVLGQELESNPRVLVFGEDVGPKGGVHAVTLGL
ncbi:MAG: thiamine pyrophosphate-dependent enzyme, partial [Sphingomicrobium sp.]